ncbi:MAG: hypothetical protein VW840_07720 [Gammaproteobacteria bacterium]
MTVDLSLLSTSTQTWARDVTTADIALTGVDSEGNSVNTTLSGQAAAAYLFGQALRTVSYQDGQNDGLQLTDGLFEFPAGSGEQVTLAELSDALLYKYGVDPVIEFAPGLGLRGYSVTDINDILQLLNREYSEQFLEPAPGVPLLALLDEAQVVADTNTAYNITDAESLLATKSTSMLAGATDSELREYLTEGGEIYINRDGGFYINGIPTNALDLSVTARLLAQDNISSEYKVLMDAYAERNNETDAAWTILDGGLLGLADSTAAVENQYGMQEALSQLTAGQFTYSDFFYETDLDANTFRFDAGSDPFWEWGTRVRVGVTGSGLVAGQDYYVTALGNGTYSFHLNQSDALSNQNAVILTGDVPKEIYAADVSGASVSAAQDVKFPPPGYPDNGVQLINLLDYARYVVGGEPGTQDNYLEWGSINPGWPEDTKLEFTGTGGGLTAGTDYFVANHYDGGGAFLGTQITASAVGDAGTTANLMTGKPSGQALLYDEGDTPGYETWSGYNQFSLPGTDYASGTAFSLDRNVDIVMKHELGDDRWYKDIVALKQDQTYYLRNEGGGMYSVYATEEEALAGGEWGRFYFAMDTYTTGNGNDGGYDPYISSGNVNVNGITSAYITIKDLAYDISFTEDPLWGSGPTEVRVRDANGGFQPDVSYWAVQVPSGGYEFYTNETAADFRLAGQPITNTSQVGYALTYASDPLPDFFRVSDQFLEDTSAVAQYEQMSAVLNTVISNNVRDGDLDQEKLQTLTAQLQNNTEAMTALIKVFADLRSSLAQALR